MIKIKLDTALSFSTGFNERSIVKCYQTAVLFYISHPTKPSQDVI